MSEATIPLSDRGFGAEVKDALQRRYNWLEQEGLVTSLDDGTFEYPTNIKGQLSQRELKANGERLSKEIGKPFGQVYDYERFDGVLKGKADLTSGAFAVVERSQDFVLVPWRPVLENHIGQALSGVMHGADIDWSFGRNLGIGIEM